MSIKKIGGINMLSKINSKILLGLFTIICSPLGLSQNIDVFPEREVSADRTQIKVSILNNTSEDIFCSSILNFVTYRSQATINNIEESLPLTNISIPAYFTRNFNIGAERTQRLRKSGLYPDAYIDVVSNDLFSTNVNCTPKAISAAEKRKILREETDLSILKDNLKRLGKVMLSDGLHYPLAISGEIKEEILHLEGDAHLPIPDESQGTKWIMDIRDDGSMIVKFSTVGLWENAVFERLTPGSSGSKNYLNYLLKTLRETEESHPPVQGNGEIRNMLIGVLTNSYRSQGFEKVPYKITQNTLALTANSTPGNGIDTFLSKISMDTNQNWTYFDRQIIANDGRCLAVKGDEQSLDGGNVFLWECNGTPSQKWKIVGNTILSFEGLCLDIPGNQPELGVQIWSCNGNIQQNWNLHKL
jgi:hypothetical protein